MKKLLLLMIALLTGVSGVWADETTLPEITSDANDPMLYVIKNTRSNFYMAYRSDAEQIRQSADISTATLWYFTAGSGQSNETQKSVRFRSYFADGKAINGEPTSLTAAGYDVTIKKTNYSDAGLAVQIQNYDWYYLNDAGQTAITKYYHDDAGSVFVFIPLDDLLEDLRTQYSNKVDGCETLTAIFSSSDCATAKTAITNATTGLEIIEAYETLIATANDQLISLKSQSAQNYISFGSGIKATTSEGILKVVSKHDLVAFQNPETSQYISCPLSQSSQFQASNTPDYFQFVFDGNYSGYVCLASSNARTNSGTLTMHDADNGSGNIVTWYSNAANSFFQPASKGLDAFKASIKAKLDAVAGWQPIYSSSDIAAAKTDVEDATTIDEVNTIYANAITSANGKLLSIENYSNTGKYMSINATNVTTRTYPTVIKLVVNSDLTYSLQGYLNFGGYYAEQLKNVNYTFVASSATAGKYRLGYNDTKGFIFYSTEHSGCLHYSNANIVRWYDDADASYWTVADVSDAAYLGSYYNALLPYQSTYGQYGYYKSGTMSKSYFDESIIETSAGVLADLTTNAAYITPMKSAAKNAYDDITPVIPVAGDFLRIKASDNNKSTTYGLGESNLYLTSSNCASQTGRAGFAEGAATDNTTIFYYDGTNLTGFSNGLQPTGTATYAQMSIGTVGASPTVIGFDALYGTEEHSYRVKFSNGGRALYTQRGGSSGSYYYYTDAAGSNNSSEHYRYFLEKVTSLPVTFRGQYASFYSPVDLEIPDGVKAYTAGTINGGWITLNEIEGTTLPHNTGVILEYEAYDSEAGDAANTKEFTILTTTTDGDSNLTGTVAAASCEANSKLVLGYENSAWGIYKYLGDTLGGFKAYMDMPEGVEIKGFTFSFNNADAIVSVLNGEQQQGECYDLSGRRVSQPTRGLYIVGGKKVMVK